MKDRDKDIIIGLIIGAVIFALVMIINPREEGASIVMRLCDGFFVSTVFVLGSGGLVWCRNKGAFDMITFGISSAFHLHFPLSKNLYSEKETFVDYKERKAKIRKPATGILIAGAIYLALSFMMLIIYYIVS